MATKKYTKAKKAPLSTGRKIWIWTAIVISALMLALMVGGIFGTWAIRGVAVDVVSAALNGIHEVAGVGREAVGKIDGGVTELRTKIGDVEDAVDQVSQNVSDSGVVMTLLPPAKEQELVRIASEIKATVASIVGVFEAASGMWQSIDRLPFVNLPELQAEKATKLEAGVQDISDGVNQLATDIQQFRDGAAGKIDTVSSAAGTVNTRLGTTQDNLATLDSELDLVQTRALELIDTFRTVATILAIVAILMQAWIIYALVVLIMKYWAEWKARAMV
jgi:X-X-X-Leu-X-X-Gly heptad repeat protein